MWVVGGVSVVLLVLTTVINYEVLRALTMGLPRVLIPARSKLIVVIPTLSRSFYTPSQSTCSFAIRVSEHSAMS